MSFNVGDLVQLKSGSPVFTVSYVSNTIVGIVWFNPQSQELKFHDLNASTLALYEP